MRTGYELGLAISRVATTSGGSAFWLTLVGGPIAGLVNVTKRQKRVAMPRRVELQSLLRSLPEAVVVFDCNAKIIDANQPAEALAGMARSEMLGRDAEVLTSRTTAVEANSTEGPIIARALRGEYVRHERHSMITPSPGQVRDLLVSSSPMRDQGGRLIGALLVLQDVTELAALQRQAENSERHLAVGQMTAGLAHDFNNVLNSISDAIYLLGLQKDRSPHDRTMLDVMQNAVHRGSEIVSNIREYLRGNRDMRKRLDTCQVLVEALQLAEPLLETRPGIKVVRFLQDVPEVEAVPAELRRVFNNLMLNALEAMQDSGTLTLRCHRAGECVMASVADTGPGIPLEKQKMIFSAYYTTKPNGTGLGLAGARRAIHAMGGEIRFESTPGAGTTFQVMLPIADKVAGRRSSQRVA